MIRLYFPNQPESTRPLTVTGNEARHAIKVVRIRAGDRVDLLDGAGMILHGKVDAMTREELSIEILNRDCFPRPDWAVHFHPAVIKNKAMDWMIQKATELGVTHILPILGDRSVVELGDSTEKKMNRWRSTAIEAMKQSGNPWLPEILEPAKASDLLRQIEIVKRLNLVAALNKETTTIRDCVKKWLEKEPTGAGSIGLWIGPEGDFTEDEMALFETAGFRFITLGPHVLRSETAAVAGLAVINQEILVKDI